MAIARAAMFKRTRALLRAVPLRLRALSAAALVAAMTPVGAATITDLSFSSLPGNRVQVKISLDEAPSAAPMNFTIDNPARIALDFPETGLDLASRNVTVGVGNTESVTAVEAGGRSRVVVNLSDMVPYDLSLNGNVVVLTLDSLSADIETEVTQRDVSLDRLASDAAIEGIDFRRGPDGEGMVIVKLSDPSVGINIEEQAGKVLVDFTETGLPESLDRKLDVVDFATPAREIDTFPYGNGSRMVITPSGTYEHLAYQTGNTFTVELRPLTEAEQEKLEKQKFGYTGERLSLNFQDIEVRAVLQLIADFTSLNLVAADSVQGSVTLRLKNVPWDQAMDIILKSKGLGMRQQGNVLMVAPQEEIAQREKLELESQQQLKELAPLRTEFIQVDYARAGDIAQLIQSDAKNLLTERGNITVDERTNTLLVQETAETIGDIRALVQKLDIPVRQVLIESRIVIASEDFSKDVGVRLGYSLANGDTGRTQSAIGGGIPGDVTYDANTTFNTNNQENYIVSLPAAIGAGPGAAFRWSVGKFGSYLLQLELSALQAEGRGEVISAPRVVTANQQKAVIEAGTEIPFQQATSSGATSTAFKSAVLRLEVTPRITPDDRVIMDLAVNKDAVGTFSVAGIPAIDTNAVETQVLVDNGDTVVLGGIYESNERTDITSIPVLGELPYLGRLFRRDLRNNNKQELLIFVTPKILKESLATSGVR